MTEDISFDFHFDRPVYKISYKKQKKKKRKKKLISTRCSDKTVKTLVRLHLHVQT